jgi:2-methylaconitate cis-trans-isomerase PrpF
MAAVAPIIFSVDKHTPMTGADTIPIANVPLEPFQSGTAALTLTALMNVLIHTGAAVTYTLPAANAAGIPGKQFTIVNHGSGTITFSLPIRTATATTITTLLVATTMTIISDGTQWRRLGT